MNILSSFFADDLAIDLGTVNTVIFTPEQGIVLNEPSILAIHKYSREMSQMTLRFIGRSSAAPSTILKSRRCFCAR